MRPEQLLRMIAGALLAASVVESASAQRPPDEMDTNVSVVTGDAALLPFFVPARLTPGSTSVQVLPGSPNEGTMHDTVEAFLGGRLGLRAEFNRDITLPEAVPQVGLRAKALEQARDGLDFGVAVLYGPRDFRGEGNVLLTAAAARRFGKLGVLLNAGLEQDPEGDDRNLNLRLAVMRRFSDRIEAGFDARGRADLLSSDRKRVGSVTADWDLVSGAAADLVVGPFTLLVEAGLRAVQTTAAFGEPGAQRRVAVGPALLTAIAGTLR